MKKLCAITTVEGTMNSFIIPAMEYFVERGFEVTLVCNMSEEFIRRNSSKFHCVNMPMRRGISIKDILTVPFKFWKLFRREKFDYVQYATTNASFYAAVPAMLTRIKTRVYCQWGLLYIGYKGIMRTVYKCIEKFLCSSATHITVASHKNLEFAVKEHLMPSDKASVIGDGGTIGVDFSVFDVNKRSEYKKQVLAQYPLLTDKIVFGYVGRIETDKGVNELLEAFLNLNNQQYALLLIGAFDELRSNLNADLLKRAKESGRVIFNGYTNEVPKYLSAIDILVHPTYREGFSMVIQQAMAMGCAIVTTDIPGPSEVIVSEESGILVQPYSAVELAGAMDRIGQDAELRNRFVKNGLERVSNCFNRERMLKLTYEDRLRMMSNS